MLRYEISHPVVNDRCQGLLMLLGSACTLLPLHADGRVNPFSRLACSNMALWRDLGVSSWPTLVVVSPRGRVLAMLPG